MTGDDWAPATEKRITDAFQTAPFTERNDGTFRVDTDPRYLTARENLNWSVALVESLNQLHDLLALDNPDGSALTPSGHRASSVDVGHMLWASVTAMGVLDRIAAAFGALQLGVLPRGHVHDLGRLWDTVGEKDNATIRVWMRSVRANATYTMLRQLRDPMTHRTMPKMLTASASIEDIFSARPGQMIPTYDHPDEFRMQDGRSVGVRTFLDEAAPFLRTQLDEALLLLESGAIWPHDHPDIPGETT